MTSAAGRKVGVGIKDVIGKALKQMRLVRADAQMMELHLRLRPGKRARSLERHCIVMLVGEIEHISREAAAIVQNAMRTVLRAEWSPAGAG